METKTIEQLLEDNWYWKAPTREEADEKDYRADFANSVANLLVDKVGDIDKAANIWKEDYDCFFEEYVKNIYEVENLIPLKQLASFKSESYDNWDFNNKEEHELMIQYFSEKCVEYYMNSEE